MSDDPNAFINNVIIIGNPNPIQYIRIHAIGINSSKKFFVESPSINLVKLPDAAITNTNVAYIQNGPYKSGLSPTLSLNFLLNGIKLHKNLL